MLILRYLLVRRYVPCSPTSFIVLKTVNCNGTESLPYIYGRMLNVGHWRISDENGINAMVHGTYACVCILEYVLLIHRSVGSGALLATLMIMIDQPVPPSVSSSQKSGYTVTYHSVPRFLTLCSVIRIHEVSGAGEQEFKLQVATEQNHRSRVLA